MSPESSNFEIDHTPKPELLAPAGGPEALRAAVNNGADAVYLGVGELNARRGAENFDLESLAQASRFAHVNGARVYLAANIAILTHEMASAVELVDRAWAAGVDAVIVQDIGLMSALLEHLPHVRVHASTQVGAHNTLTIEELATLGAKRVTLARETSIAEIRTLSTAARERGIEIESFVHGALCFSYSGQCLMSSVIGGRSGNRGLCAQPCRLSYELLNEAGEGQDTPGGYLLSPKDLLGIEHLPALIGSGAASLKIEGRLKRPEYVALVTGVYRRALDRAAEDPEDYRVTEAELSVLAEAYSRGFSSAYLAETRDNSMMSYQRPNNRGIRIGRVASVDEHGHAVVALDRALGSEDKVEFWTRRGRFAQQVGPMTVRGARASTAPAGEKAQFQTRKQVAEGDRVFRVANAALEAAARRTFAEEAGGAVTEIDIRVVAVAGKPLSIEVSDGTHTGLAEGAVVETARTKAITSEEIVEHVGRLGGTPYVPRSWDIELQPGIGMGFSALHKTRRAAIDALEAGMLSDWSDHVLTTPTISSPRRSRRDLREAPELVVRTHDSGVARACLNVGAARAIMPHWAIDEELLADPRIVPELPRVAHDEEMRPIMALASAAPRLVAGNLGLLRPTAATGAITEAHWSLNAVNPWTVDHLKDAGAGFVWLSPELSERQIAELADSAGVPVGISAFGRQEVMVTEHCVLMAMGECSKRCSECSRREGWYGLRDQKGYTFPMMTDPAGRTHIYNSVPLDLSRSADAVLALRLDAVRLDFTVERARMASRITTAMRNAIVAAAGGRQLPSEPLVEGATVGHFFRGVK